MAGRQTNTRRRFPRLFTAALLAAAFAVPQVHASSKTSTTADAVPRIHVLAEDDRRKLDNELVAERLMSSTCHIQIFINGRNGGVGTGFLIDVENRLIVTNHHVVDNDGPVDKLHVFFPVKRNGEWLKDERSYQYGVKPAKGTVVASSNEQDLALVQLDYLPENAVALPLARKSAPAGSQLHSIGGKPRGTDAMWVYTVGRVRQVGRGRLANGQYTRIIEAQMALNAGNSGGPIVNDFCELVGVCEGGRYATANGRVNDVSMLVDVKAVRTFLGKVLPLVNPQTAEQFHLRGRKYVEVKRYTQAVRDFSAAIKLDSKSATHLSQRGWAFLKSGDNRTAMSDFEAALKLDATLADAYQGRGRCFQIQKKFDEAIRDYTNAIRFEPENAMHYNMRGVASLMKKDAENSYRDFVQATTLEDSNVLFLVNRGYVARALKLYKDAAETYEKAIKLQPENAELYNELGNVKLDAGENSSAADNFTKAIVLYKQRFNKENWQYLRNWGVALFRDDKLDDAYKALTKAVSLNPNDAELHYLRGLVAKKYGNQNLATENFRKAAELDPKKYANAVAENSTNAGDTAAKSTPAKTTPTSTAAVQNRADKRFIGVWVVKHSVNSVSLGIAIAFGEDGGYASSIVTVDANQKKTTNSYQGRYAVGRDHVTVTYTDGSTAKYRYGFRDGKLWYYHPELKTMLYFERYKQ